MVEAFGDISHLVRNLAKMLRKLVLVFGFEKELVIEMVTAKSEQQREDSASKSN